ncbi:MAG: pyridoxal phosphate-dependent aminotransferase [Planctomycetota bacterium]
MWLCTPHAPTGRVAPKAWLERVIDWAHAHHMVVLCDEPYTELWLGEDASPPTSALEVTTEGVMVFQSLSKRSTMTGYRVGFVAGDARLVQALVKVKTNADTGTPWFVQEAAIAALEDEAHVVAARERYRQRAKALLEGLMSVGLQATAPEASIYIWQRLPEGVCDVAFAKRLLDPQVAIACTPGSWLAEPTADGENPGKGYVRFALVPTLDRHQEAAERLRAHVRVAEMVGAKR